MACLNSPPPKKRGRGERNVSKCLGLAGFLSFGFIDFSAKGFATEPSLALSSLYYTPSAAFEPVILPLPVGIVGLWHHLGLSLALETYFLTRMIHLEDRNIQ